MNPPPHHHRPDAPATSVARLVVGAASGCLAGTAWASVAPDATPPLLELVVFAALLFIGTGAGAWWSERHADCQRRTDAARAARLDRTQVRQ